MPPKNVPAALKALQSLPNVTVSNMNIPDEDDTQIENSVPEDDTVRQFDFGEEEDVGVAYQQSPSPPILAASKNKFPLPTTPTPPSAKKMVAWPTTPSEKVLFKGQGFSFTGYVQKIIVTPPYLVFVHGEEMGFDPEAGSKFLAIYKGQTYHVKSIGLQTEIEHGKKFTAFIETERSTEFGDDKTEPAGEG